MKPTKTENPPPKLNVKLLRKIKRHILEEPKRLQMRFLVVKRRGDAETFDGDEIGQPFAQCGTAACIAGWAMLLSGVEPFDMDTGGYAENDANVAAGLLGFPKRQWRRLFLHHHWPHPFSSNYQKAKTVSERAKIASARIEHLIKTGN